MINDTTIIRVPRYIRADGKNFDLNTIFDQQEKMCLTLRIIPHEILDKYNLLDKVKIGQVYIRIDKGMYDLPQGRKLANNLLIKLLTPHGYHPVEHTHGLWQHETWLIAITLIVDCVDVKYVGNENADHLL
jgi:hypothetical protein